ncbi:MAG: DUF2309 family protein, partial [Planctomycetaceae bacterium]|nr:DUF2309 family protein [Planctomycetaceae bacterium]
MLLFSLPDFSFLRARYRESLRWFRPTNSHQEKAVLSVPLDEPANMQNTIDPAEEFIDISKFSRLRGLIEHVAHLLPAQGPINVFVHHNTLHAFEELPFDQAVQKGNEIYGCEPYLLEEQYRDELKRGRISSNDLFAVLLGDLEEEAHVLIGFMGTRFHLRLAMLEHSLRTGPTAELRWVISESDALTKFREETSTKTKQRIIEQTRVWVMRDLQNGNQQADSKIQKTVADLTQRFPGSRMDNWSDATWESFTLHLLWEICYDGSQAANGISQTVPQLIRHRDFLLEATLCDSDELVNEVLIRFCAAFLDQGFANWSLPDREKGFFEAFRSMFQTGTPMEWWLRKLPDELNRITESQLSPLEIIAESLSVLGVPESQQEEYITQTLLALRGWAGIIWQMETNAEWAVRPAPTGTLLEYLAVRLLLERMALAEIFQEETGQE